jgi:hypothetical protein
MHHLNPAIPFAGHEESLLVLGEIGRTGYAGLPEVRGDRDAYLYYVFGALRYTIYLGQPGTMGAGFGYALANSVVDGFSKGTFINCPVALRNDQANVDLADEEVREFFEAAARCVTAEATERRASATSLL